MKSGRKLYVAVQTSEKNFLTFTIQATDKGGHSSRPTADNPIYRLSSALARLSQFRFPVHLTATTKQYFARRAELEQGQVRADMLAISLGSTDQGAIDRLSAVVETNIMLRTTCTATMIDGGHAENALPQRARATIQCRVVPGVSRRNQCKRRCRPSSPTRSWRSALLPLPHPIQSRRWLLHSCAL